jgi:hypothetical protein
MEIIAIIITVAVGIVTVLYCRRRDKNYRNYINTKRIEKGPRTIWTDGK